MIYLDNAATTKPFDSVTAVIEKYYKELYFNPSALYSSAVNVASQIENARHHINAELGGGGNIFFTSCATESNAWAYNSGIKNKKGNIVVSMGEHASGYENAKVLISKGYDVRFVKLQSDGRIDYSDFVKRVDENTTFISVIHCSNETGAINDIKQLVTTAKSIAPKAIFHSDGVQALGKIEVNCNSLGVDLYSVSAHKIGGVKGIGGLWIKNGIRLTPLLCGGGQEAGARSGTENTAGIVGFAEALAVFKKTSSQKICELRENMKSALSHIQLIEFNDCEQNSPYILSFSVPGVKSEIIQRLLSEKGILLGLGSACASRHRNNRILEAMGRTMPHIEGSMRISFSHENTNEDIKIAANAINDCIRDFRGF